MRAALILAVLVAAVGCGTAQSAAPTKAETSLTMSLWADGKRSGVPTKWTLRCKPAGGTLRQPAAACRKLDAMKSPFAPLRKDLICTEIYGGPQQAVITGTYKGRKVWVLLAARNGCEIDRWTRLGFLVGGVAAGGASS